MRYLCSVRVNLSNAIQPVVLKGKSCQNHIFIADCTQVLSQQGSASSIGATFQNRFQTMVICSLEFAVVALHLVSFILFNDLGFIGSQHRSKFNCPCSWGSFDLLEPTRPRPRLRSRVLKALIMQWKCSGLTPAGLQGGSVFRFGLPFSKQDITRGRSL